jgi:hypothetical protein
MRVTKTMTERLFGISTAARREGGRISHRWRFSLRSDRPSSIAGVGILFHLSNLYGYVCVPIRSHSSVCLCAVIYVSCPFMSVFLNILFINSIFYVNTFYVSDF